MRTALTLSLLSLFAAAPALADHESRSDRREMKQDARESVDDHFDYVKLRNLLARFDQARAMNDLRGLQTCEAELNTLLYDELRESEHELRRDNREVYRSQNQVYRDRRRGFVRGPHGRVIRVVDDRRDRDDDLRDARVEAYHLQQKRVIQQELAAVAGRQDPPALGYRRERIVRLLQLGGRELRENQKELREDRRELREDRRYPR